MLDYHYKKQLPAVWKIDAAQVVRNAEIGHFDEVGRARRRQGAPKFTTSYKKDGRVLRPDSERQGTTTYSDSPCYDAGSSGSRKLKHRLCRTPKIERGEPFPEQIDIRAISKMRFSIVFPGLQRAISQILNWVSIPSPSNVVGCWDLGF